jgi:gamma-glutamyltranspeptidase/glutathione hydrolase
MKGFDLPAMGHNSAEYLHTWIECAKLAFADREAYYGDPAFDGVPFDALLSKDYAAQRRALIGAEASHELRPGDVGYGVPDYMTFDVRENNRQAMKAYGVAYDGDTTHLDAIDREGNMVAATPSGGWIPSSPVIAGLGFPLGTRGQMFYLNPERPNALAPRKRPRATLTPSLVTRDGEPWMVFGTPGGDCQDQWTVHGHSLR